MLLLGCAFLVGGCDHRGVTPEAGATFSGAVESRGTGSFTVEFAISAEGTTLEHFQVHWDKWSPERTGSNTSDSVEMQGMSLVRFDVLGQAGLPVNDGSFTFSVEDSESGDSESSHSSHLWGVFALAVEGWFISPTQAAGTLKLVVEKERTTCDLGVFTWTATA